jgi:FkbM family methyltransferase
MREIKSSNDLATFYRGLPPLVRGGQLFEELVQAVYEAKGVLTRDSIAIDAGANRGLHTFPMARIARKVIAFEPHPYFAFNLRSRLNNQNVRNVVLFEQALAGNTEERLFYMGNVPGGNALSIYPGTEGVDRTTKEVLCVRLDHFLGLEDHPNISVPVQLDRIDLIKSDLDGHDFEALKGAARAIDKFQPILVFEFGKERTATAQGFSKEDFFSFFDDLEYSVFDICGVPFLQSYWSWNVWTPWDMIAVPRRYDTRNIKVSIDDVLRKNKFEPLF